MVALLTLVLIVLTFAVSEWVVRCSGVDILYARRVERRPSPVSVWSRSLRCRLAQNWACCSVRISLHLRQQGQWNPAQPRLYEICVGLSFSSFTQFMFLPA